LKKTFILNINSKILKYKGVTDRNFIGQANKQGVGSYFGTGVYGGVGAFVELVGGVLGMSEWTWIINDGRFQMLYEDILEMSSDFISHQK
jgi:hypothetical protein